jgi:hypothetical protein
MAELLPCDGAHVFNIAEDSVPGKDELDAGGWMHCVQLEVSELHLTSTIHMLAQSHK